MILLRKQSTVLPHVAQELSVLSRFAVAGNRRCSCRRCVSTTGVMPSASSCCRRISPSQLQRLYSSSSAKQQQISCTISRSSTAHHRCGSISIGNNAFAMRRQFSLALQHATASESSPRSHQHFKLVRRAYCMAMHDHDEKEYDRKAFFFDEQLDDETIRTILAEHENSMSSYVDSPVVEYHTNEVAGN
eukprot:GEZU01017578.1.p1 GENE.GEZU01017578.1~~GEZU01017578.1.p1  ORF type:complete len:189 (-),score=5.91 GEZU01017578.1:40-606(-)